MPMTKLPGVPRGLGTPRKDCLTQFEKLTIQIAWCWPRSRLPGYIVSWWMVSQQDGYKPEVDAAYNMPQLGRGEARVWGGLVFLFLVIHENYGLMGIASTPPQGTVHNDPTS